MSSSNQNTQKLNRYCMMIISKYFNTITDYIKMEKCCKEYRGIIEQFRFNPISLKNPKNLDLFRNIQTYQFYDNPINGESKDLDFLKMLVEDEKYDHITKIAIPGIIDENEAKRALNKKGIADKKIVFTRLATKYKREGLDPNIAILNEVDPELRREENRVLLNSIVIPTQITQLAPGCFEDVHDGTSDWKREKHWPFTRIDIPSSVSEIGSSCFYNCRALKEITLPSTIHSINDKVFFNCYSLSKINLSTDLYSLGKESFYHCTGLTELVIPSSVSSMSDCCFSGCSSLSKVSIPSSINQIPEGCFSGCRLLTHIDLPNSITSLGKDVFSSCAFKEIILPDSIKELPRSCFAFCHDLKRVKLPSSLTSIGSCCFITCSDLLAVSTSLDELKNNVIDIPSTVSDLGNNSFFRCYSIQKVVIHGLIKEIPNCAFGNCNKLSSINIPKSVTSVGSLAFTNCSCLRDITIPSSVVQMAPNTFQESKQIQVFFRQGSQIYNQFRSTGTYKYPCQRVSCGKFTPLF